MESNRDVKATIISHEPAGVSEEGHRFVFAIKDGLNPPGENVISLRLSAHIHLGLKATSAAVGQLVVHMMQANPQYYDSLINQELKHR